MACSRLDKYIRRLLGISGDDGDGSASSLHLTEMGKSDVWNLIVDMGNSSNFAERYEALVGLFTTSFLGNQRFSGRHSRSF